MLNQLNNNYTLNKTIKATLFTAIALLAMIVTMTLTSVGQPITGPLGDYGFVLHRFPGEQAFLGSTTTLENNAQLPNEDHNDGWLPVSAKTCSAVRYEIHVTVPDTAQQYPIYLNALFDWNQDGNWSGANNWCPHGTTLPTPSDQQWATPIPIGAKAVEWGIQNLRLDLPPFNLKPGFSGTIILPEVLTGTQPGGMWVRFTISTESINENLFIPAAFEGQGWNGQRDFLFGESEDYFTCLIKDITDLLPGCPTDLAQVTLTNPAPSAEEQIAKRQQERREARNVDAQAAAEDGDPQEEESSEDDSDQDSSDEDDSEADDSDQDSSDEDDSEADDSDQDNSDEDDSEADDSDQDNSDEDDSEADDSDQDDSDSQDQDTNQSEDTNSKKDKESCNNGVGNGSDGCTPGNSTSNDDCVDAAPGSPCHQSDSDSQDQGNDQADSSKGSNSGQGNGDEAGDPGNSESHNNGGDETSPNPGQGS